MKCWFLKALWSQSHSYIDEPHYSLRAYCRDSTNKLMADYSSQNKLLHLERSSAVISLKYQADSIRHFHLIILQARDAIWVLLTVMYYITQCCYGLDASKSISYNTKKKKTHLFQVFSSHLSFCALEMEQ